MEYLGFGDRWRNWIANLWGTTSSCFLLNGQPGKRIIHARGVRQGDSLSPLLFLLAMEPLHRLFQLAQHVGMVKKLHSCCDNFRTSLYADDATVFIHPECQEFQATKLILQKFGAATGLITNLEKTEIYLIQCQLVDLDHVLGTQFQTSQFPCTYLGLPLHFWRLPRTLTQPLVQKVASRLPGWKHKFFTYPERETLLKSVLAAIPTYFLTSFNLSKWAIRSIEKLMRSFLWRGKDYEKLHGGHCLVRWATCCRPKQMGGLEIKDLEKHNRALRLRWLWYKWDAQERPWKKLLNSKDKVERLLFFSSTEFTVGSGNTTPFWDAFWLNGTSPRILAPNLYEQARYKFRTIVRSYAMITGSVTLVT